MLDTDRPTRGHGTLEPYLARRRADLANKMIRPQLRAGRILDIGCGSYPTFLSSILFAEKWGVDQLVDATNRVHLTNGHVDLLPFDAHRDASLPFENEFFSVVTMLAVFEHIEPDRLVPLLREVWRVLVSGGQFVMTTPAQWTGWLLGLMARLGFVSRQEILEHKGSYDHDFIRSALDKAGFDQGLMQFGTFEAFANLWVTATK